MRETGASDINDPERIIDWFAKNQKFAKRTLLDRTLGLPDYEKAWQQFLTARAAAHSSAPGHVRSLSPETWLVKTLSEIDYEAFVRATKKVKGDHAIIDWFIKNEGLGTKKAYEQAWQNYLSSLAKERQEKQSQPVIAPFLPQPAVAPIPYQPGVIAPPAVAPIPHEPGALARGEPDPEQTVMQGVHPIFQETGVRGHVIGGGVQTPFRLHWRQTFPPSQSLHWQIKNTITGAAERQSTIEGRRFSRPRRQVCKPRIWSSERC